MEVMALLAGLSALTSVARSAPVYGNPVRHRLARPSFGDIR